jgi:selenocysteine-specific elongation factor
VQVHGEEVKRVGAGQRVALNLTGVETQEVPRGTLVVRGEVPETSMFDARYTHLKGAPDLADGAQVRVLLGTAERIGRLYVARDVDVFTEGSVPVQLRLDEPLGCLPGDRFVVRLASPLWTLGGGVVVDPWAPRMRKKRRLAHGEEVDRLAAGEDMVWLERAGEDGIPASDWSQRSDASAPILGDRAFAPRVLGRMEGALLEGLSAYHEQAPLSLGAHRRELLRGRLGHLDERVFDALVDRLATHAFLAVHGPLVRLASFSVEPTPAQLELKHAVAASLEASGFVGLPPKELHARHPEPEVEALARLLESEGKALLVPSVGWIASSCLGELRRKLHAHFEVEDALSPADFKAMTGLSRKTAIPLLEWLDKSRWTARRGDTRVQGAAL